MNVSGIHGSYPILRTVDVPAANGIAVKYAISVSVRSEDGAASHKSAERHGRALPASIFPFTFRNNRV